MSMDLAELSDMEMVYEEFLLRRYKHLYLGMYARGCKTLRTEFMPKKECFSRGGHSIPMIIVL